MVRHGSMHAQHSTFTLMVCKTNDELSVAIQ